MTDLNTIFIDFLTKNHFAKNDQKWLVAVSGGVDSIVLCHLCHMHKIPFAMAHCNFQLRGEESERDEAFVREFADQLGVELMVKKFDTNKYATSKNVSIQVAARELRYNWFEETIKSKSEKSEVERLKRPKTKDESPDFNNAHSRLTPHVSRLATAHHADDNLETVFFNLFRGTGIRGLRGILPVQGYIIRPMLGMHKPEILEYATANNLNWVEDSSNASDKYSRNFIRNQILPMIKEILPAAEKNVVKSLEQLREAEMLYEQAIDLHKKKLLEIKGNEIHIPILKLAKAKPLNALLFEILKPYNFTAAQTQGAIDLMKSETGSFIVSATHRIFRNRNWLIIAPLQTELARHILIEKGEGHIQFSEGFIQIKSMVNGHFAINDDVRVAQLDAKGITFPLILRPWKIGDYFYPLGMQKKKKLGKFFIDKKLSKTDKEKVWIIESNKKILWVVGHRIDDRFKLTERTEALLELRFKNNI